MTLDLASDRRDTKPIPPPTKKPRPLIGVAAVLVGAIMSTLYGRLTTFGLADIRGAVHAGIDEGAWITTASTVGQMVMGVAAIWLGTAYGVRRVLFAGTMVFGVACLVIPFAPNLPTIIALQFLAGLGSGTYVPLTIGFVLRSLKPGIRVFGIAAYCMSLELSLNVPASLEGFYVEHWGWQWIFWQQALLSPLLLVLVWQGMPREPVNLEAVKGFDVPSLVYLSAGLALAYAALDQGDRLDWLGSGVIVGLIAGAMLCLGLFLMRERTAARPIFPLAFVAKGNLPILAVILILYRFTLLATSLVVPQFLTLVQGYRALEVGDALIWIALPQFIIAPLTALVVRRVDPRLVMAIGFGLIGLACLMVATGLTTSWVSADFVPSQLVQAVGQTAGLIAFITFMTRHIVPQYVLTFGALLQTVRLFGGELGIATMTWFVRTTEQMHSNLIGLHVRAGDPIVQDRLHALTAGLQARAIGLPDAQAKASSILGRSVQSQAYALTFIDAMSLVTLAAVACLALIALLRPAPSPPPAQAQEVPHQA